MHACMHIYIYILIYICQYIQTFPARFARDSFLHASCIEILGSQNPQEADLRPPRNSQGAHCSFRRNSKALTRNPKKPKESPSRRKSAHGAHLGSLRGCPVLEGAGPLDTCHRPGHNLISVHKLYEGNILVSWNYPHGGKKSLYITRPAQNKVLSMN